MEMAPFLLFFFLILIIEFHHVLNSFVALYRTMAYIGGSEASKDILPTGDGQIVTLMHAEEDEAALLVLEADVSTFEV